MVDNASFSPFCVLTRTGEAAVAVHNLVDEDLKIENHSAYSSTQTILFSRRND